MKPSKNVFLVISVLSVMGMLSACSSVKPYQKSKINDADMILSARKAQKFEQSFQLY